MRSSLTIKSIVLIISAIVICRCGRQEADYKYEFTTTKNVSGHNLDLDIIGALDLKVVDSLLIVSTQKKVGFWSFYSLDDKEHLGDFLSKGNSNKEFLGSTLVGNQYFTQDIKGDISCYIYDFRKGGLKIFNVSKSLNKDLLDVESTDIRLPRNVFSWVMLNDGDFVFSQPDESRTFENRYVLSNNQKTALPASSLFEDLKVKLDGDINDIGTIIGNHPTKRLIVECGKKLNNIYLYNVDNTFSKIISVNEDIPTSIEVLEQRDNNEKRFCFKDIECTDNYFCVLFSGNTRQQEMNGGNNSKIFIFDWEGTPIISINLDRAVTSFSFDWPRKKLYTLNFRTEEISEFDISQLEI